MTTQTQESGAATNEAGGTQQAADQAQPATQQSTTANTEGQQTEGQAKSGAAKADGPVYEIKAPEGVTLDQAALGEFTTIAKELKLDPGAAQKLADVAIKQQQAQVEAWHAQVKEWETTVTADPVLGKPEALAAMRKVVDTFGDDELKTMLSATGYGNHPALARFVHKISKTLSEDAFVAGRTAGDATKKSLEQILYGNS